MKATWNGTVIAESDDIVEVEGNAYFPRSALNEAFFEESSHTTICSWKGTASYLSVVVDGQRNDNAAWYYPAPKEKAQHIEGRVAFWKGVKVG
ncbi:MAG: DUF427 domain-containing protein [Myxococcota bacterium]